MTREETIEVHRPDARLHRAHVQLRDGREVDHHLSGVPPYARHGLAGDRGHPWNGRGKKSASTSAPTVARRGLRELQEPVLPQSACSLRFLDLPRRDAMLLSRAVDETGYVPADARAAHGGARHRYPVPLQPLRAEGGRGRSHHFATA